MWPIDLPFAVQPLSWVGAKRRPTQFASNKNAPGIDYAKEVEPLKIEESDNIPCDEPATTPAESGPGDLRATLQLRAS